MSCYTFMVLIRGTYQSRNNSPTTVGSRSTNNALGTCFPPPVSLKNVLKESSPPPSVLSLGIWPSGWMPCSKQYNSQHAFPIWTPAWPTWIDIHSRYKSKFLIFKYIVWLRFWNSSHKKAYCLFNKPSINWGASL